MKSLPHRPPTILLLTTDPRLVFVVRQAAETQGYAVTLLQDPISAYHLIGREPGEFDVALVDLDPGMNATALLSTTLHRVPVVVVTSLPQNRLAEAFRHRGILHCLNKPLTADRLIPVIQQSLATMAAAA